jgi:hypothetical protein
VRLRFCVSLDNSEKNSVGEVRINSKEVWFIQ